MKKPSKWIISVLALLCAFSIGRGDREYTATDLARAREAAYSDGYHAGFDAGTLSERAVLSAEHTENPTDPPASEATVPEGYAPIDIAAAPLQETIEVPPAQVTASIQLPVISSQADTAQSSSQSDATNTVYVTKSGTKYHKAGCSHLSKSSIEKTLSDALAAGYTPCKTCKP